MTSYDRILETGNITLEMVQSKAQELSFFN